MKTKNPITYNMNVEDSKNIMILKYDQDPTRVGNEMVVAIGKRQYKVRNKTSKPKQPTLRELIMQINGRLEKVIKLNNLIE